MAGGWRAGRRYLLAIDWHRGKGGTWGAPCPARAALSSPPSPPCSPGPGCGNPPPPPPWATTGMAWWRTPLQVAPLRQPGHPTLPPAAQLSYRPQPPAPSTALRRTAHRCVVQCGAVLSSLSLLSGGAELSGARTGSSSSEGGSSCYSCSHCTAPDWMNCTAPPCTELY